MDLELFKGHWNNWAWIIVVYLYELCSFVPDIILQGRPGGGSGIPVYPKKIRQNIQKYPKFIQIYPKLYPGILYTWNSKKVIYRIPVFKLQYTVDPIWKAPVYRISKNPGRPWYLIWRRCDQQECERAISVLFQSDNGISFSEKRISQGAL